MTDLVEYRPRDPAGQLVAWADAARSAFTLAESLVRTNVCPPAFRNKPQEATAVILLGAEVGLSPIAALRSMFEIKGQLGMYVRAQVALVQSRGHRIWTEVEQDDRVVVKGYRAGDPEHVETSEWTLARARQAGFIRRGANNAPSQYELQPRAMLWARAAGDVARRIAADVLAGIPEVEEPEADTGQRATPARVIQRQPRPVTEVELPAPQPADGPPPPQESPRDDDGPQPTLPLDLPEPEEIPLPPVEDGEEPLLTPDQLRKLQVLFVKAGVRGPEARHAYLTRWLERPVEASNEITVTEASAIIDRLEWQVEHDG